MKKYYLVICLLSAIILSCCNGIAENDNYSVTSVAYTYTSVTGANYSFDVAQVEGISNKKLERKINETLEIAATERLNDSTEWMMRSEIEINLQTQKVLCLTYTVCWSDRLIDGNILNVHVIVDMETGARLLLDDIVDISALYSLLCNYEDTEFGHAYPGSNEDATKVIQAAVLTEKEFLDSLDNVALDEVNQHLIAKPRFALTDKGLVIWRNAFSYDKIEYPYDLIAELLLSELLG